MVGYTFPGLFPPILDPKRGKMDRKGAKNDPKRTQKEPNLAINEESCVGIPVSGPPKCPEMSQNEPKWTQNGPRMPQTAPRMPQIGQDPRKGPKSPRKCPEMPENGQNPGNPGISASISKIYGGGMWQSFHEVISKIYGWLHFSGAFSADFGPKKGENGPKRGQK